MRRRAGVGAIQDRKLAQDKFKDKAAEMQENQIIELNKQLNDFKTNLESFAVKHKKDIKKDPEFRAHFQQMCAAIGVDPLASTKGFWSDILGNMNSYYHEIAVQAVEIVLATAHTNGGVMTMAELRRRLNVSRARNASAKKVDVTCNDILSAFKSLKTLGKSCGVVLAGGGRPVEESLVFCVPEELSLDNTTVVQTAVKHECPYMTVKDLIATLNWTESRVKAVVDSLLREGIIWLDDYKGNQIYWFPSLFQASRGETSSISS